MAYHVEKSACAVNELLSDLQRAYVVANTINIYFSVIILIC